MKRANKQGGRPRVRRRQMLHEQRIDKIYRPLRQDTEKFFYDPLWSLDHTLPRLFLERECEFYGYKLRGFQAGDDAIDGEIALQAGKLCLKASYNMFVYEHQDRSCGDIATLFLNEVLQPMFNTVAQARIKRKRSQPIDCTGIINQLRVKERAGLEELTQVDSKYYFWPVYDLLETLACGIPAIKGMTTHQRIFLCCQLYLEDGTEYEFNPSDFTSVSNCIQFLAGLAS